MGKVLLSRREYQQAQELFKSCMDVDRYRVYFAHITVGRYIRTLPNAIILVRKELLRSFERPHLEPNEVIIQVYYGQLLREKVNFPRIASVPQSPQSNPNNPLHAGTKRD